MAAPAEITFKNWNSTVWAFNKSLSGNNYNRILSLQGVDWMTRKIIASSRILVAVKQTGENDSAHLELENRMPLKLPGSTDIYSLDWEPRIWKEKTFGNIQDRARWVLPKDLKEEFHKTDWEDDSTELMELFTQHDDVNATTSQMCGFEIINGERRYSRRIIVRKGEECVTMRLAFDYLGPDTKKA